MGAERLAAAIEAQRPNLALWIPVLYGLGIAVYFALPAEPQGWMLAALGGLALVFAGTALRAGPVGAGVPPRAAAAGARLFGGGAAHPERGGAGPRL